MRKIKCLHRGKPMVIELTDEGLKRCHDRNGTPFDAYVTHFAGCLPNGSLFEDYAILDRALVEAAPQEERGQFRFAEDLATLEAAGITDLQLEETG